MWSVNERVLVRPEGREEWLPGTIRYVEGLRHYVILDAGDDGWFDLSQLRPCEDSVDRPNASAVAWQTGDRVFARWGGDLLWYPGTVFRPEDGGYRVVFDDQDQAVIPPADLTPLVVQEGDQVMCRPKFEPELRYYPATVTRVAEELIDVDYDDLDLVETNTCVGRLRVRRLSETTATRDEGDEILASGRDGYWYPARVLVVDADRLFVQFCDNRHGWLRASETRLASLELGQTIEVRRVAADCIGLHQ